MRLFNLLKVVRIPTHTAIASVLILCSPIISICAETDTPTKSSPADIASHTGSDVYTYWREAGMSWAAPYLAGLAVLAYQVEPKTIVTLLQNTAVQTKVGAVIQPENFIQTVRKSKNKK